MARTAKANKGGMTDKPKSKTADRAILKTKPAKPRAASTEETPKFTSRDGTAARRMRIGTSKRAGLKFSCPAVLSRLRKGHYADIIQRGKRIPGKQPQNILTQSS